MLVVVRPFCRMNTTSHFLCNFLLNELKINKFMYRALRQQSEWESRKLIVMSHLRVNTPHPKLAQGEWVLLLSVIELHSPPRSLHSFFFRSYQTSSNPNGYHHHPGMIVPNWQGYAVISSPHSICKHFGRALVKYRHGIRYIIILEYQDHLVIS